MLELWQRFRFYGFLAVFVALPALGCLWVLLGWPAPSGGLAWWLAVAVAPWWLLAAGGLLLGKAGVGYALHRLDPKTRRQEEATGRRVPAPRPVRERGLVGLAALLLAGSALFPRHAPDGALLWESSELKRRAVLGTLRWEGEKMVEDFTDQLVWSCHYLTFHGIKTRVHTASRQFPYCSYFVYLYPRT